MSDALLIGGMVALTNSQLGRAFKRICFILCSFVFSFCFHSGVIFLSCVEDILCSPPPPQLQNRGKPAK